MPMQHYCRDGYPGDGRFRDGRFRNGGFRNKAGACRPVPNPSLDRLMRWAVLFGALLVVALPAARGSSDWFGALPLWLVGMPLASWWALHRFRLPLQLLPTDSQTGSMQAGVMRRRAGRPQAQRWVPVTRLRQWRIPRVA